MKKADENCGRLSLTEKTAGVIRHGTKRSTREGEVKNIPLVHRACRR